MYSLKQIFFKKKGSVAIMLSAMVSAGVLFTIYITQKMTSDFMSDLSQSLEEWEKYLVSQSAQNLAAYLIANNIILCREKGWTGKSSKCIWSMSDDTDKPSVFNLSNPSESAEGLSFDGTYTVDQKEVSYKVNFNLVNWRNKSIQNLIGEIPEYVCRRSDMSIVTDASCPAYETVPIDDRYTALCQRNGTNIPDTKCEYVSPVDGDYYIVLTKVDVPFRNPVSDLQEQHTNLSGIRRPLSMATFKSIVPGKRCNTSCGTGKTTAFTPDCRSDLIPLTEGEYTGVASKIITVRNEGPGALYQLSLLKTEVELSTDTVKLDVTPDIISLDPDTKQVLLPEEELTVEYFYTCPHIVRTETVYVRSNREGVSHTVRDAIVPFSQVFYSFYTGKKPLGICYTSAGEILTATADVDAVIPVNRDTLNDAACDGAATCSHGGESGTCQYADIEPRRLFANPSSEMEDEIEQRVTNHVTTIQIPPPPVTGGGGDGDGGGN